MIRERLGQGGMGIVYAGEQPVIGKRVAIKVLRPEIAHDPDQMQRLLAEARAVNAIRHRGIIDIFNFGQLADRRQYVVMEYLHGQALDELIAHRGPLHLVDGLEILDEVMAALGAGHEVGIIHRDLKPSNIYLVSQPDGSRYVKILDFGLAKQSLVPRGATAQTRTDTFVGTPEYVAPEQARAEPVGPYTDLYAAGVVTFEMLTGRLPFEASAPIDYVIKHLETKPPPPSKLAPGIPREVDALVLRMLQKEPRLRPPSCDAVRREIGRIRRALSSSATNVMGVTPSLHGAPVPAHSSELVPPLAPSAPPTPVGHHSRAALWLGVALSTVALVTAGAALFVPDLGFRRSVERGGLAPAVAGGVAPNTPPSPARTAALTSAGPREGAVPARPVTAIALPGVAAHDAADQRHRNSSTLERSQGTSNVPDRDELLRRIDRLEDRLHERSNDQLPAESVIALLRQYRADARVAESSEDRRDLARRLQRFEQRFVSVPTP